MILMVSDQCEILKAKGGLNHANCAEKCVRNISKQQNNQNMAKQTTFERER